MVSPIKRILITFQALTVISVVSCFAQSSPYIRVAIIQDAVSLSLKINGSYEIVDSLSQKVLSGGRNLKTTVTSYKYGILIGGMNLSCDKVFIKTKDVESLIIDGRRFNGDIQFVKKDNSHLLVINYVDLEDYIKGILYHEVSHYWPSEALKAQAIVCRTYALYQMQENRLKDFDVTCDIYSQVYGGKTSERYRTNKAVDATKNEVLNYQGKIFPAYYHATCAGHTEDASLLWNIDIAPLKGVTCGFCQDSPHFRWHKVLSLDEIEDTLIKSGCAECKNIKNILILDKDKSGRISNLNILTDKKDIKIAAKDFRNMLGPNVIRSTNFNVKIINRDAVFEGFGWGHGVGLCQWGSYFMAKKGYTYKQILQYYYPQSNVKTLGF